MTPPNIVQGRLSLRSFIKLSVIAAVGVLPVLLILIGFAELISYLRGSHSSSPDAMPVEVRSVLFWVILPLKLLAEGISIVIGGFFTGLCGYPFYSWLCRHKPGGVLLKGQFDVL